jgi:2-polyprenyl-3-methyl-5-hydroxy-6-metoxy-1,4-benzoquinol methylase
MKAIFDRAAARYAGTPRFYHYAKAKLPLDPAFAAIVELLRDSTLPLLDLGCGMGLLDVCLREAGYKGTITGVDVDEKKIAAAKRALGVDGGGFAVGDALNFSAHAGNVVMLDVLNYFTTEEQRRLLERVAASVAPGGLAIIRTAVDEPGWRFNATKVGEWIIRASGWIPTSGWNFPKKENVERPFLEKSFTEELKPLWGLTPFNGYLFVFRRPA